LTRFVLANNLQKKNFLFYKIIDEKWILYDPKRKNPVNPGQSSTSIMKLNIRVKNVLLFFW